MIEPEVDRERHVVEFGNEAPIPDKLFFRIGEVADLTGVPPYVLRYWESEFKLLRPRKNHAGQRVYRKHDVQMVLRIKSLLYEDRLTLEGAKKRLQQEGRPAASSSSCRLRIRRRSPPSATFAPGCEAIRQTLRRSSP